jgi:hypothetical protein
MDDALFLKTARAQIEASGRLDLPASLTLANALRLLEMAERGHNEHDHDRTIADVVKSWEDAPPDASKRLSG